MSQSPASLKQATRILEQIWLRDSTLGDGLNWRSMGDDAFRAEAVSQLAFAIRYGWSTVPLRPLQYFAIDYAHKRLPDGLTTGVGLIGDTDAPGQYILLKQAIRSPDRDTRGVVIGALGRMCSKSTHEFLQTLAGENGGFDEEGRKRAAAHLEHRTTNHAKTQTVVCAYASADAEAKRRRDLANATVSLDSICESSDDPRP